MDFPEHTLLEKIESQRAPGEFTPAPNASPAMSTHEGLDDGKLDDSFYASKLEEGDQEKPGDREKKPITHRPTGFKVNSLYIFF